MHRCVRNALLAALVISSTIVTTLAQVQESASITASPRAVKISFLPPPLDGTISLGIYDGKGKLVRILQRESDVDEFQIGNDALSATWDGKDENDQPLPPGKYHARGYAVGDLAIEGIDFYFNDWVTDERPERIARICAIGAEGDGAVLSARLEPAGSETLICNGQGEIVSTREEADPRGCDNNEAESGAGPIAIASGRDHTRWVIERSAETSGGTEVKQYASGGELLRRLAVARDDPQPHRIAASLDADRIFLVEENDAVQRVRGLRLVDTQPGVDHTTSEWKVDFEKTISAHKNFGIRDGKPVVTGGATPSEKLPIKLLPNSLQKDQPGTVELAVGIDGEGSILKTADGLPLQTISETKHLTRAVLSAHDAKSADVFQDDGAVVEQFRISNLDRMMAFDCGEIELK